MNAANLPTVDDVRALLIKSVAEVFATMVQLNVKAAAPVELKIPDELMVAGSVGFTGEVSGVVYLHLTATFAQILASRMLAMPIEEIDGEDMVNDVIGELSNMIVGSVKSHLCDAGLPCMLTVPSVVRGKALTFEPLRYSSRRLLSFAADNDYIQIELLVRNGQ